MNHSAVDSVPAHNPAVDLVPARVCLRFSNTHNSAVDSVPAHNLAFDSISVCLLFCSLHFYAVDLFPAGSWLLFLLFQSLNFLFPQTTTSSSLVFAWQDQPFFLAQSRIATFLLQLASRQSRAHNHRLLSALVTGPIDQAVRRLGSFLHDLGYLAVTPSEFVAALDGFRSPLTPAPVTPMPPLLVTNDMRIALADDIIDRTARLATLSPDAQLELHAMAKASLDARMQRYTVWTAAVPLATPSPALSRSGALSRLGSLLARLLVVIGSLLWLLILMRVKTRGQAILIICGLICLFLSLQLLSICPLPT
jgi:hypothetical protein